MPWTAAGSAIIGAQLNLWLYGIVCHMYATYWQSTSKHFWWLRILIPILFLVDTAQTVANCYLMYDVGVQYEGPLEAIIGLWPCQLAIVTQAISAFIVTVVLIPRLYRLTKDNRYIAAVFGLYSLAVFATGLAAGINMWRITAGPSNANGVTTLGIIALLNAINLLIAWHSMEAALSFLISGCLIFVLSRSRTGFKRTDSLINTLIRGALQTGCFSSIFSLVAVIAFKYQPLRTSVSLAFILPLGRLYSVTLMDTILTRDVIRQSSSDDQAMSTYASRGGASVAPTNTIELHVRKEVAVHYGDAQRDDDDDTAPRSRNKAAEVDGSSSLSNYV